MTFERKDVVQDISTTAGTGAFTPSGAAPTGFQPISVHTVGATFRYKAVAGAQFEIGTGTWNGTTVARSVRKSSNGDALVNFTTAPTILEVVDATDVAAFLTAADGIDIANLPVATSFADADSAVIWQAGALKFAPGPVMKAYYGASSTTSAATVSGVTISPSTASLAGGGTQAFTATVTGTNSPAQTVTWSATGGTITTGGAFTAPAGTTSAQTITVTATSTVDNTKSGTATVTVAANTSTVTGVTVTPSAPTVNGGVGTQQFTAAVAGTNSPSQGVTWTATGGTINSSGLFAAPLATGAAQTVTVTATSTQNGSFAGTATVTVPAQTITVTTPATAPTVGTAYTLAGTYTGPAPTALDYQTTDNAGTPSAWTAAASPVISGGTWSFSVTPTTSSTSRTATVRDHVNTGVTGTSGTYVVNAAAAATMASQYQIMTGFNTASVTGPQAVGGTSPDLNWGFNPVRVNVKSAGGAVPLAADVILVFGKKGFPPPATFAAAALPAGSTNGNAVGHANGVQGVSRLAGWTDNTSQYFGTLSAFGVLYAWGTAGTYQLFVVYRDESWKAVDNGTGTPLEWNLA